MSQMTADHCSSAASPDKHVFPKGFSHRGSRQTCLKADQGLSEMQHGAYPTMSHPRRFAVSTKAVLLTAVTPSEGTVKSSSLLQ